MSDIIFTADTHFGHKNIIKYCNRPYKNIKHMDESLIYNWNTVVDEDSTVYMLGDFTLGKIGQFKKYCARLNGDIYVIPGSHDKAWIKGFVPNSIHSKTGQVVKLLHPIYTLNVSGYLPNRKRLTIILCHYALRVWDKSHFNSYQLFGHSHGKLRPIGKQYDVGVDNTDYFPITLDEIYTIMKDTPNNLNYVGRR